MRLLVCDVEGTIFKAHFQINGTDYPSTMWQPIAAKLGEAALEEEKKTHEKWDNKEYNHYLDWVKATIDIHKKYSLKKDDFNNLINKAQYNDGVVEFFNNLNRKEWLPVLISYGFQNLIRRAQNDLDIEYGFGACEYFFDEYGYLQNYNLQPSDFEGKIHFLDTLIKTFNLNKKKDWVFIGDGKNDEAIAKIAPIAFGINPHEKLKAINGLIKIKSFMDVFYYIENVENNEQKVEGNTIAIKEITPKQTTDEICRLNRQIISLKKYNRKLKQKLNDQKGKIESRDKIIRITVDRVDYEKTPRVSLPELIKGIRVVFLGLDENKENFRRLKSFSDLRVIAGMKNNFDTAIIKNADFLFIYKNCITHSDIEHALSEASVLPCCYLLEPTNNELLENALANVLYRYIYE
ncbi:MAG: hypothetical protein AB9835_01790 [Eubacteriales bacterium]